MFSIFSITIHCGEQSPNSTNEREKLRGIRIKFRLFAKDGRDAKANADGVSVA